MPEPTNKELRQACEDTLSEACLNWRHSDPECDDPQHRTYRTLRDRAIARALLSRLDREAEAPVKVERRRQGGIADCACGETVFDSMRYCPGCGKPLDFKES